jgi:hypothetical protein
MMSIIATMTAVQSMVAVSYDFRANLEVKCARQIAYRPEFVTVPAEVYGESG